MLRRFVLILGLCLMSMSFKVNHAEALDNNYFPDGVVRVGVTEIPPFAMKDDGDRWNGIAVELWDQLAKNEQIQYQFYEYSHEETYEVLSQEKVDVALFLERTRDHENLVEYSRTYLHSDLAIASLSYEESILEKVGDVLSSPTIVTIALVLLAIVVLVSLIFWWLEKHANPILYDQKHGRGNFINGVMWAILLVTAQEPDIFKNTSLWGRIVALLLLFVGITVSASYIALITSALTVNQLSYATVVKSDLPFVEVGVLHHSRAAEYLDDHYIKYTNFESIPKAMTALEDGSVKAILADKVELDFFAKMQGNEDVVVQDAQIETEYYTLAFPEDSDLRKFLNPKITKFIEGPVWRELLTRYKGDSLARN